MHPEKYTILCLDGVMAWSLQSFASLNFKSAKFNLITFIFLFSKRTHKTHHRKQPDKQDKIALFAEMTDICTMQNIMASHGHS